MSRALEIMESEWLSQLAVMKAAISDLKLSNRNFKTEEYGQDLNLSDEDFSYNTSSDDLWDLISESSDNEYVSDPSHVATPVAPSKSYDRDWLGAKCVVVSQGNSGLDAGTLRDHILATLASDSSGELF